MYQNGKLTNRRKTLHKNKGVAGLITGSQALYDWVDDNPGIITAPLAYINDPAVVAQNDSMTASSLAASGE